MDGSRRASVTSLENADAGSMTFSNVDMSKCFFFRAHSLGSIGIEPTVGFGTTPVQHWVRRRCAYSG
jgi:hypothetical protein